MDRESLGNKLFYAYSLLEIWIELNQGFRPKLFVFDGIADFFLDSFILYGYKTFKVTFVAAFQVFI